MSRRTGWFLALTAFAFGAVIIACHLESGVRRWQAAAWRYAALVPGSPATWGIVILTAGILLLYGCTTRSRRALVVGFTIAFLWFSVLTAAAGLAVVDDLLGSTRQANPLAVVAWMAFAVLYADAADDQRKAPR